MCTKTVISYSLTFKCNLILKNMRLLKMLMKILELRHYLRKHPVWFAFFILMNILSFSFYIYLFTVVESTARLPFKPLPYLINTSTCHLKDYLMFDRQTQLIYRSHLDQSFGCNWNTPPFSVRRFNGTWIELDLPDSSFWLPNWECFAVEIRRREDDKFEFGQDNIGPLGRYTNFAHNLTSLELKDPSAARWDSVKVSCIRWSWFKPYTRVVPLVQYYRKDKIRELSTGTGSKNQSQVNVLMLGIDSVSRLNFLRHMVRTKTFIESRGFIPLYGYHKIGENSFPNVLPMFIGRSAWDYCNRSNANCNSPDFNFDAVPFIFKEYAKQGYLTSFIEDMPQFGFFTYNFGRFVTRLFDYYLRPTNLAILDELYWFGVCYQEKLENELYWDYIYDQLEALHNRGNQPFISFAHMSSLTHWNYNYIGYVDKPFHMFLERLFASQLNNNTVIMFYADHAIRFGLSTYTKSHFYEERLPFFYIYIPDTLKLEGRNADDLRKIVHGNQHLLTSHIDLHATMLHLLNGRVPRDEPYGRSLLAPIPTNRTCDNAGIPPESCLCIQYREIEITPQVDKYSHSVISHMNNLMQSYGNYCVPLTLSKTDLAYRSVNDNDLQKVEESYMEVHFYTDPNEGHFKAVLRIGADGEVAKVNQVSRTNEYGDQSKCVTSKRDIAPMCLCWDVFQEQQPKNMFSRLYSFLFN